MPRITTPSASSFRTAAGTTRPHGRATAGYHGHSRPRLDRLRSAEWRMLRRLAISTLTGMKPLPLILSFLPLIVFSLLARLLPHGDIGAAALAAAVIAAIAAVAVR